MPKYIETVKCAETISERFGIPLGDIADFLSRWHPDSHLKSSGGWERPKYIISNKYIVDYYCWLIQDNFGIPYGEIYDAFADMPAVPVMRRVRMVTARRARRWNNA